MRFRLLGIAAFGVRAAAATVVVDPVPEIPIAKVSSVKCIVDILKSNPAVQSVDLYSMDEFRVAIEFAFNDKDRRLVIADTVLSGSDSAPMISGTIVHREPDVADNETPEFLSAREFDFRSICHLRSGLDNAFPRPKSREQWRRVVLPDAGNDPH